MSEEKKKKKSFWKELLIMMALGLVIGSIAAGAFIIIYNNNNKSDEDSTVMQGDVISDTESSGDTENKENSQKDNVSNSIKVSSGDYSALVESVMPSVVTVKAVVEKNASGYDMFGDLYGSDYPGSKIQGTSTGTGFIIGQNGNELLLATNNHVVEGAKSIKVTFVDGKEISAELKGGDADYDVAVLSIDGRELDESTLKSIKIAAIGDSDALKPGDVAIAIGNALGYGQSVTVGYVSALDRTVELNGYQMDLIQIDTAINEGNSGGPLMNVYGEVVGITNAKKVQYSSTKVEGVSYAIPLSKVIPIINELMNRVNLSPEESGYLGIKGKDVSERYSKAYGMPKGIYVVSVGDENSPAYKAGIHKGDIITAINGRSVTSMDELKEVLSYIKYGTEVEVTYSTIGTRDYDEVKAKVILAKRSDLKDSDG